MFEREIMELDSFVDMPISARLLYVYVNLDADDEGFLGSPKKVMRAFGGSDDDMKILIAKGFLIAFESGVVVVRHWKEHNKIRGDRIKKTRHTVEKESLQLVDNQWVQPTVNQLSTNCQPNDAECPPSIGLGLVLDSGLVLEKILSEFEFDSFWDAYQKKDGRKKCEIAYSRIKESDRLKIKEHVFKYVQSTPDVKFRKNPLTYLHGEHWEDEIVQRQQVNSRMQKETQTQGVASSAYDLTGYITE